MLISKSPPQDMHYINEVKLLSKSSANGESTQHVPFICKKFAHVVSCTREK